MRIIIIPNDGFVSIDGEIYSGLDLSFVDSTIHAVQWYNTEGEIERKDARGRMIANETITSIDQFQMVLDLWQSAKNQKQLEEAQATQEEANTQTLQQSNTTNN